MPRFPEQIETDDGTVYAVEDVRQFMKEWKPGMVEKWDTWFNGQTGIVVGVKFCIYDSDFTRFCEQNGLLRG